MHRRTLGRAKITDVNLQAVCDTLRRQPAASIEACDASHVPGKPARSC